MEEDAGCLGLLLLEEEVDDVLLVLFWKSSIDWDVYESTAFSPVPQARLRESIAHELKLPISAGQSSLDSAEDFRRCMDSLEGDENEVNSALPSSDPSVNAEEAPTQHEQKQEVPSTSNL
ncbi:Uncharacterized protein Fot_52747 [Forsythia ovata]|uniref:Uncharacterized protein n=1 Tax=Forsythia ovata TaxID=205694 RepID=A0ABD1PLL1_9LAMI